LEKQIAFKTKRSGTYKLLFTIEQTQTSKTWMWFWIIKYIYILQIKQFRIRTK